MMKLRVTHETRYDYTPAVETAQHLAHLRPLTLIGQQLLSHSLTVDPQPALLTEAVDVFGNVRTFFSLQAPHRELTVTADSVVETCKPQLPEGSTHLTLWEHTREVFRFHAGSAYDAATEFVFASPCVPRHLDFLDYARPSFVPGGALLPSICNLMERIYTEFTYASQSTEVNTPAQVALKQKKGVCQDFSHIMIACLRSMNLPARYVSGYLLTEPPEGQARLVGADASHAWVSAYIPGLSQSQRKGLDGRPTDGFGGGWFDFCPTNNRWGFGSPGEDYVTLALGRDFSDVSPMRGMIHGGANHSLHVGVTVQPLEPDATPVQPALSWPFSPSQTQSQFQLSTSQSNP
jgi:transglutaminase-like putative cysteine protease